jgi:hypothetical protein
MPNKKQFLIADYDPPYSLVQRVANQSIPTGVWTVLAHDTIISAQDIAYDLPNSRYVIPVNGLYGISAFSYWAANTLGIRGTRITLNGNVLYQELNFPSVLVAQNAAVSLCVACVPLSAGDLVKQEVYQGSGGALNSIAIGYMPGLSIYKIKDL